MTIETVLTDEQIGKAYESMPSLYHYSMFARAIEQALLQSPEVQRLREDAGRYRWMSDRQNSLEASQMDKNIVNGPSCYHLVEGVRELKSEDALDDAIDAAMEKRT